MRFFSVVLDHYEYLDGGSRWLWNVVKYFWVLVGCFEWFNSGRG